MSARLSARIVLPAEKNEGLLFNAASLQLS
jgi:hypothetical protein